MHRVLLLLCSCCCLLGPQAWAVHPQRTVAGLARWLEHRPDAARQVGAGGMLLFQACLRVIHFAPSCLL